MKIWKYPLSAADQQNVKLPIGSKILDIQMQGEIPCLWAIVNDETLETETRTIAIYGTGHTIPDDPGKYISTFQLKNMPLDFHAFEYFASSEK